MDQSRKSTTTNSLYKKKDSMYKLKKKASRKEKATETNLNAADRNSWDPTRRERQAPAEARVFHHDAPSVQLIQ